MTRYGMAIDLTRCIGCNTCAVACKVSNNLPRDLWYNVVHTEGRDFSDTSSGTYGEDVYMSWRPVNCMHCAKPICEQVCPTGATYKRDDGIVAIDEDKCIGCRSCMMACPYNVRRYLQTDPEYYTDFAIGDVSAPKHIGHTVEKCNFCAGRIERGDVPACMELCPGRARYWGDLDDPNSDVRKAMEGRDVSVMHEDAGTQPSVFYLE